MSHPKILVFGKTGQLASALNKLSSTWREDFEIVLMGRPNGDITEITKIQDCFKKQSPSLVINASAYTAVDDAETDEAKAFALNALSLHNLATECKLLDIPLIHVSTDYVFNGSSPLPYKTNDQVDPINAYGRSKLAGEWACRAAHPDGAYIIRSSWVYSEWQSNFVKTMLRLAQTKTELSIVDDQVGSPTYAVDLAEAILHIAKSILLKSIQAPGVYHFANSGECSWYQFAHEILKNEPVKLKKTSSEAFPRAAARPAFSILDSSKLSDTFSYSPRSWETALNDCLKELNNLTPSIQS